MLVGVLGLVKVVITRLFPRLNVAFIIAIVERLFVAIAIVDCEIFEISTYHFIINQK